MNVYIPERYVDTISKENINDILKRLKLSNKYKLVTYKANGRCIIIENSGKYYYVIISRETADARNAFLAQYIPTGLTQYFGSETKNKQIYIYLLDTSAKAKTNYIIDCYRFAKTLGIKILNEADLKLKIQPYYSFGEWKRFKTERQNYNSANFSSFAIEDDDEIIFYGKLYGANGKDAALTACVLSVIAKQEGKTIRFIQVMEHGTEEISTNDRILLNGYGVNIENISTFYPKSLVTPKAKDKSTCRKQDIFKFNLLQKFGEKKCYLCDCGIESNIIASHIHRVTDIDNSNLSMETKIKQAIDGDNGFWLCANHDKLFENGQITFNTSGNLKINGNLTEKQIDFVKEITKNNKVSKVHTTANYLKYLKLHNKRVGFVK